MRGASDPEIANPLGRQPEWVPRRLGFILGNRPPEPRANFYRRDLNASLLSLLRAIICRFSFA